MTQFRGSDNHIRGCAAGFWLKLSFVHATAYYLYGALYEETENTREMCY